MVGIGKVMARIPLIGGKLDGKEYTHSDVKPIIRIPIPTHLDFTVCVEEDPHALTTYESQVYILDSICVGTMVAFPIYRAEGVDIVAAIRMLLNGYRQPGLRDVNENRI